MKNKLMKIMWVVFLCSYSLSAHAALIQVNTVGNEFNNDGDCSLREAVTSANKDKAFDACAAGVGVDIIKIPAGTYQIYQLKMVLSF